jgi:putative membrane protein
VRFAAERTLLAWLRTGLGLMGFGFVVARFGLFLRELEAVRQAPGTHHGTNASLWIGVALVGLGVLVSLLAARQHSAVLRRLDRAEPYRPPRWSLGIVVALVLATLGLLIVMYLVAVGH